MAPKSENGWTEYRRSVLENIQDNKSEIKEVQKVQTDFLVEITKLKVKAGAWGLMGGAISVMISIGIGLLLKMLGKI